MKAPKDIDAYVKTFPAEVRAILEKTRALIHATAPGGMEKISYGMPAVFLNGRVLVYFAAFKEHLGVFPPTKGDDAFMKAIAPYAGPKGNLKFPYARPIPYALIRKVIRARMEEVLSKGGGTPSPKKLRKGGSSGSGRSGPPGQSLKSHSDRKLRQSKLR